MGDRPGITGIEFKSEDELEEPYQNQLLADR
jgi:hypothetical protein